MLHDIFNYLINLPVSTWEHTAEWIFGTAGLSTLILAITHVRAKYTEVTGKFKVLVTGLASFLVAAATAYVGSGINLGGLGKNGLAIAGALTFLYHFGTSPLYKKWFSESPATETDQVLAPEAPAAPGFETA